MNKPKQLTFPWNKVKKSSLEGFYTSQENSHIVSLLKDRSFLDDLFIYGTKESGKTFLLQAMCNSYSFVDKSSLYIPLKKVMNYGIEIFDSLENIDLICVDGIEEVISKIEWEKAIFNLINKALISAAEKAGIKDFVVKNYKKPMDPFDVFLNELLENINIEMDLDPRLKLINSKLEKHLKLIDPEKRNILMYCFECEVK